MKGYNAELELQIEQEVIKSLPKVTQDNIDGYLSSLVKQAKAKGHASAIDVEPGIKIASLNKVDPQKIDAFIQKMHAINGTSHRTETHPEPYQIEIKLADLLRQIEIAAPDSKDFTHLTNQYMFMAQQLTPDERVNALAQLGESLPSTFAAPVIREHSNLPPIRGLNNNSVIGNNIETPVHYPSTQTELQALEMEIASTASGSYRGQLIKQYFQLTQTLPQADRAVALLKLNQLSQ